MTSFNFLKVLFLTACLLGAMGAPNKSRSNNGCDKGVELFNCFVPPCNTATCPEYPEATCVFQTVILGELDKWVPISPMRVDGITWTNDTVTAPLSGAPGESFDFWYILKSKQSFVTCKLDSHGSATFKMDGKLGIATC